MHNFTEYLKSERKKLRKKNESVDRMNIFNILNIKFIFTFAT